MKTTPTRQEQIIFWEEVKTRLIKNEILHSGICFIMLLVEVDYPYLKTKHPLFNLDNAKKHANATGNNPKYFWWDIDLNHNTSQKIHGIIEEEGIYDLENRIKFIDWIINTLKHDKLYRLKVILWKLRIIKTF